jgi:hypothetical protein
MSALEVSAGNTYRRWEFQPETNVEISHTLAIGTWRGCFTFGWLLALQLVLRVYHY